MVEIEEEDDEIDRLDDLAKYGRKIFPHVYTQAVGWLIGPLIQWNAFGDFPILAFI